MFKHALENFGNSITAIQGLWTDGNNLELFNQAIKENKSAAEAAFATITGQWAKRNGYDQVQIIQNVKMKSGDSGSVKVLFTKSEKK